MADSQKMAKRVASGGMRIDDHANWTGKAKGGQIFADGAKMESISEQEGSGSVMRYEDTEKAIKSVQEKSVSQTKKYPMKEGYRY
jgi:hypothetical protein